MLSRLERQTFAGLAVSVVVAAVLHEVVQLKELGGAIQAQLLQDHYGVLGVSESATEAEIANAYKRQTTSFQSRPTTEEGRAKRAKVIAAYEILSRVSSRETYDVLRKWIVYSSQALSVVCVVVPVLAIFYITFKLVRYWSCHTGYCVDPSSFDGKVVATFKKMQTVVKIDIDKPAGEKLGMQLVPVTNGTAALQVASVVPGSVVDTHNVAARVQTDQRQVGWHTQEVLAGDCVVAVNGVSDPTEITGVIGSATSLQFEVRRTLESFLPWACEADLRRASAEDRWGCHMGVASDGSGTMEVLGVDPSGVLERWNREHPSRRICAGDRIVAVNRELGSSRMLANLQDSSVNHSRWICIRGVKAEDRFPEVTCGPLRKGNGQKLGIRIGTVLESPVRGSVVEIGEGAAVVVKEVVPGYLVDVWNKEHPAQQVFDGAAVVAVNGNTNPTEFAQELGKQTVTLRTRPPRGAKLEVVAERPEALPKKLDLSEPVNTRSKTGSSWLPRCCRPRCFEARLRDMLTKLRCEYNVVLHRTTGMKVGLSIDRCRELGGLAVTAVQPDGLVNAYNSGLADGCTPCVRAGDTLIKVNDATVPQLMIEELGNQQLETLSLRFSRKPAEAAPGIWEASVERAPGEGWGMQLQEQALVQGPRGHGPILIEDITAGLAVDRWNSQASPSKTWLVKPGDFIVGCEEEVGHDSMLAKLKGSQRVRLTLLRWHAGAAPDADDDDRSVYRVVVEKAVASDKLGISLGPCAKNPTRTVLTAIKEGGLVDFHNQKLKSGNGISDAELPIARVGDEVLAVNGQRDPSRFLEACAASCVEMECRRCRGYKGDSKMDDACQTSQKEQITGAATAEDADDINGHGVTESSGVRTRAVASPQLGVLASKEMVESAPAPAEAPPKSERSAAPPVHVEKLAAPEVAAQPPPLVQTPTAPSPPMPVVAPAAAITPLATRSMLAPGAVPVANGSLSASETEADKLDREQLKTQLAQARVAEEKATRENRALKLEAEQIKSQLAEARVLQEKATKENFMLRNEVEQLKAQLADARSRTAEFQSKAAEAASLGAENKKLKDSIADLEWSALRWQSKAEGNAAANADLASENKRLTAENAQLMEKLQNAPPIKDSQGAMTSLAKHLASLQEASETLERILASDDDEEAESSQRVPATDGVDKGEKGGSDGWEFEFDP